MTRYLVDHAVYQGTLTPADYQRAEFDVVNFKISHGLGTASVHPKLGAHIADARARGLGIGTFHWLVGNHPGVDQANHAYARMQALGVTAGTAHTVDVEEQADADTELPPTWAHVRDYTQRMTALLRRPIMLYTGDWWWTAPGRGWPGATITPYLMAAPNSGYLTAYPGDTAGQWRAGYGGWTNLAAMQYAVEPLRFPDGTRGTIAVSKAAIRDEKVWDTLTGKDNLVTSQAEFNTLMGVWWKANAGPHLAKLLTAVDAILANVRGDDQDVTVLRDEIRAAAAGITGAVGEDIQAAATAIVSGLAAQITDADQLAAVLRAALGDRAVEVGQALQTGPRP